MIYRRPSAYVPPYNYCDRWCARCTIDKTRCLLYQTEMDERLHREIDGKGEPTQEEIVEQTLKDASTALRILREETAALDLPDIAPNPAPVPREDARDAIVEAATAVAVAASGFLRSWGGVFPVEAETLRRYFALVAPKLSRATMDVETEHELADCILQAQVAHKALCGMAAALQSIRRKRPSTGDEMLELLTLMKTVQTEIERRWLSLPCSLLVPIVEGDEWGPLRDVTETLRHFRR